MQYIDLFKWYLCVQAFGIGGSLITRAWLRNLPDRGYGLGKAAGVLFGGFFYWIVITLGLASNTVGTALLALAAVWAVGIAMNAQLGDVRLPKRLPAVVIVTELVFALAFALWAYVRAYSPEIIAAGGEKYMETMMINSILRSPTFPASDAWLAGQPISYYYFGYVIFAMLIKISGVATGIAFNLGGAMIFALAFVSAFAVGSNLWQARIQNPESRGQIDNEQYQGSRFSIVGSLTGLLTAIMLCLMGNAGGLMGVLKCANALPQNVWEFLDVRDTATSADTCVNGAPIGWFDWWWDWSRVVKDVAPQGGAHEIISEFPIFSFILGDNHPHVIALPFIMLIIGVALSQFLYRGHAREDFRLTISGFALNAIALGSAGFMNTIDLPLVALLFVSARLLGRHVRNEPLALPAITSLLTLIVAYALYLPFHVTLSSQVQGIVPSILNATRLPQFLLQFAPMALAAVALLFVATRELNLAPRAVLSSGARLIVMALLACLFVFALFGLASREARAMAQEFQQGGTIMNLPREAITAQIVGRVSNPWTSVLLAAIVAGCAAIVLATPRQTAVSAESVAPPAARIISPDYFALLLAAIGAGVILAIEFVYIRDLFGTRMNSVFKFWFQAWQVWAVAGAYTITRLLSSRGVFSKLAGAILAVFVGLGLLFPFFAIPAKWAFAAGYLNVPTFDGKQTVARSNPQDNAMIDWINANVSGAPRLVEAPTNGGYSYRGRIATFTGLPAPIGWVGHEQQWRGTAEEASRRKADIDRLYSTTDLLDAQSLLKQYNVAYVIVGDTERGEDGGVRYPPEGLDKFKTLCKVAHTVGETVLYRCS